MRVYSRKTKKRFYAPKPLDKPKNIKSSIKKKSKKKSTIKKEINPEIKALKEYFEYIDKQVNIKNLYKTLNNEHPNKEEQDIQPTVKEGIEIIQKHVGSKDDLLKQMYPSLYKDYQDYCKGNSNIYL